VQGTPGPDAAAGRELILEVCEVVESNFSDARNAGYDRAAWQQLKERALARPLRDRAAAYRLVRWCRNVSLSFCLSLLTPCNPCLFLSKHSQLSNPLIMHGLISPPRSHTPSPPHPSCSAIRELLGALHDPYSRFITPTDFTSMLKYDVSGVGLNLGTAEELANKTVRANGWWVHG
jgi:hypothetical protein